MNTTRWHWVGLTLFCMGPSLGAQGLLFEKHDPSSATGLGLAVCLTPDVNGDGHPDFVVASREPSSTGSGRVYVHSGLDFSVMSVILGSVNGAWLGDSLAPVGDIDHDGLCDLVLGAPGESKAYVVRGSTGDTLFTLSDSGNGNLGRAVAGAGDVNGDGWPDVLAGAPDYSTWQSTVGRAYLHSGFDGSLIRMHEGAVPMQGAGFQLCGGVDIDLDGKSDYLVGDAYHGGAPASAVRLYSGVNGALLQTFSIAPEPYEFGACIAFVDDVDLDGLQDVAIGSPGDTTNGQNAGRVDWFSSASGALLRTALGASVGARFGTKISDGGDANADGIRDLWISAPGTGGTWGRIKLLSGSNLAQLASLQGTASDFLPEIAGGFDLDLDGSTELVAGTYGSFRLYSLAPTPGISYCTAKLNSQGCLPAMSAVGTANRSGADDFHLITSNVLNNKSGVLVWGRARGFSPLGGGNLCLAPPIYRRAIPSSGGSATGLDCSGVYDYFLSHAEMNLLGMLAGDTLHAQVWSRDPGWSPPNNIGLSDAREFTVGL